MLIQQQFSHRHHRHQCHHRHLSTIIIITIAITIINININILISQEELDPGRVGGFLRFSSVATLLSDGGESLHSGNNGENISIIIITIIIATLLSDGGESLLSGNKGEKEKRGKSSPCQTVSSLVDQPPEQSPGRWKPASQQWDLLDDDTLVGEPSEYAIWRDVLVQQKQPATAGSDAMKTSRTWTQA